MPADFNKPVKTDNYDTGLLATIRAHIAAVAMMLDPTDAGTLSNTPTGARRFNAGTGVFERFNGSSWVEQGTSYLKVVAPTVYGSLAISGSTSGYAGIQFTGGSKLWTLMVNSASGLSGIYNVTDSAWLWYFDGAGVLVEGSVPWARVSGAPSITGETASTAATGNTVAKRDGSGYLFAAYFNHGAGLEAPAIGAVLVENTAADGYLRKISLANFNAAISPAWSNISGRPSAVSAFTNDANYVTSGGLTTTLSGYVTSGGLTATLASYVTSGGLTTTLSSYAALAGAPVFTGQVRGNGGTKGLGAITVTATTGTPTGGSDGDLVLVY